MLQSRRPGYVLVVEPDACDAERFTELVAAGGRALDENRPGETATLLGEALGLWRGPPLADFADEPWALVERARLEGLRLVATERQIEAELALGRHAEVVGDLEGLVVRHAFRERLWAHLIVALYRSGRQADALEAYGRVRALLTEELGLEPGPELRDLEARVLRHDPGLGLQAAPPAPPAASRPPDALLDAVRRLPMVGREAELQRLRELWQVARTGGRRVAVVSGEAGIGKTRLVAALAALADVDGGLVLVGRCDPLALIPYQPVVEALRAAPVAEALPGDTPGLHAFLDAVVDRFDALAAQAPVLLLVEEAEHLDQASAVLLGHLGRHLPARVLLVLSFRDPPGSRHPPLLELLADLGRHSLADRLPLEPLGTADLANLVAVRTGAEVSDVTVRRLEAWTGGNPFFADEVVRHLTGRGVWDEVAWSLPSALRDVLRDRLRGLAPMAQEITSCVAVLGSAVEFGVLTRVADRSEDDVVEGLDEAIREGWLVEVGHAWEAGYAFRHELLREAVEEDVPVPRRQRLHLRAAEALEERGLRRPAEVAAAASHLQAAGGLADPERAAELNLRAADEAARLYAWDEAVAYAEAALAALHHAGAPPAQQARAAVSAATLLVRSGRDQRRAVSHLESAIDLYRLAGDATAVATVRSRLGSVLAADSVTMDIPRAFEHLAAAEHVLVSGEPALHRLTVTAQAAVFGVRTELGLDAARRALELAEVLGKPALTVWPRWAQAWLRFNRGELAAARRILEEAWATARDVDDPYLGWGPAAAAATHANLFLLDPAAAEAWCRRGLAQPRVDTLAQAHGGVLDQLVYALALSGPLAAARDAAAGLPDDAVSVRHLLLLEGRWEEAAASWSAAVDHDRRAGDLLDATMNGSALGEARRLLGDGEGALAALRRALADSVEGPQVPGELMLRAGLARLLAERDEVGEAERHLERCDAIVGGGEDWRGLAGAVELARGAITAARGRHEDAAAALRRAAGVFAEYRLPWRRADALRTAATLLAAAGRRDEALHLRRQAGAIDEELGAPRRWRDAARSSSGSG